MQLSHITTVLMEKIIFYQAKTVFINYNVHLIFRYSSADYQCMLICLEACHKSLSSLRRSSKLKKIVDVENNIRLTKLPWQININK